MSGVVLHLQGRRTRRGLGWRDDRNGTLVRRRSPALRLVVRHALLRLRRAFARAGRRGAPPLSGGWPLPVTSEAGVRVAVATVTGDGEAGLLDGKRLAVPTLVPGTLRRALPRWRPPAMPRGPAARGWVLLVFLVMMMMILGVRFPVLVGHLTRPPGPTHRRFPRRRPVGRRLLAGLPGRLPLVPVAHG